MSSDRSLVWKEWYSQKGREVEFEIPGLEKLYKANGVKRILDFGCGAGRHAVYFAERGYQVYGFDQSPYAVRQAKKALRLENLEAHLRVWDMTSLPLPYETDFFDAALVIRVIHHNRWKDVQRIVKDLDRILRVSGFIFLQEPGDAKRPDSAHGNSGSAPPGESASVRHGGREREAGIPHHRFTKEELHRLFANYELIEHHEGTDHYNGHCLIARKRAKTKRPRPASAF